MTAISPPRWRPGAAEGEVEIFQNIFENILKYFLCRRQERRQEAGKEEALRPQRIPRIRDQQLPSTLSLVISQSEDRNQSGH